MLGNANTSRGHSPQLVAMLLLGDCPPGLLDTCRREEGLTRQARQGHSLRIVHPLPEYPLGLSLNWHRKSYTMKYLQPPARLCIRGS